MQNKFNFGNGKAYFVVAVMLSLVFLGRGAVASSGQSFLDRLAGKVAELLVSEDSESESEVVGATANCYNANKLIGCASTTGDTYIQDGLEVDGTTYFDGPIIATSSFSYRETSTNLTATTSITVAQSGSTFYVSGATSTWTLPATSSAMIGATYRFVVGGALNVTSSVKSASGEDSIEGTLIVAGAVVDCDAEDEIVFGAAFENIGDYVEFRFSGTYWMLGDSGALTANALSCTKT